MLDDFKSKIEENKYSGKFIWGFLAKVKMILAFLLKGKKFSFSDKEEVQFYKKIIKRNDLVFDIGANCGLKTKIFLKCGAKVVSVEPQKECIKILERKFKKNNRVKIIPKGISSKKESRKIFIHDMNPISSFREDWDRRFPNSKIKKEENIEMIPIEELIGKFGIPKFCKIDVEGFELQVIEGLKTKIPLISFEFSKELFSETINIINLLSKKGYKKFNYVGRFDSEFKKKNWEDKKDFVDLLKKDLELEEKDFFGDIYVKG